jgi:hypothetical protein
MVDWVSPRWGNEDEYGKDPCAHHPAKETTANETEEEALNPSNHEREKTPKKKNHAEQH